jgi:lipoprotein-releasing system ATP-binding protein
MQNPILEAKNINKIFHDTIDLQVLKDINFSIAKGEFVSVIGKSGCGKFCQQWIPIIPVNCSLTEN